MTPTAGASAALGAWEPKRILCIRYGCSTVNLLPRLFCVKKSALSPPRVRNGRLPLAQISQGERKASGGVCSPVLECCWDAVGFPPASSRGTR